MLWKRSFTVADLNQGSQQTLLEHLDIRFEDFGPDFLRASMPVDFRTKQPMGLLHGGANVALAESLGSVASVLCLEETASQMPVGLEINANHLRPVMQGRVTGTCRPIRVGRSIHVWEIEIHDEAGKLTCVSRLTIAITEVS